MSDVNPVQKDVSASKTIQEDVMDPSLHLLNRFPASDDDYMVPSSAEKANIQQCIWKGGKSQNFASQRLKLIHPLRLPTVKIVMPGLAGCDQITPPVCPLPPPFSCKTYLIPASYSGFCASVLRNH